MTQPVTYVCLLLVQHSKQDRDFTFNPRDTIPDVVSSEFKKVAFTPRHMTEMGSFSAQRCQSFPQFLLKYVDSLLKQGVTFPFLTFSSWLFTVFTTNYMEQSP